MFIINYDEADGSFDHIVPPFPAQTPAYEASTVSLENEIVTTSAPSGPIGLGTQVPLLAISPREQGRLCQLASVRSHLRGALEREDFGGWYDLIQTVAEDPTFNYRLAGHVETGQHFGSGSRGCG